METKTGGTSPSTRRAWIEIIMAKATAYQLQSPSTRRAWIEIPCMNEESSGVLRRPPPGGRGSKCMYIMKDFTDGTGRPPPGGRG